MTSSSFRSGNASDDYQEESGIMDAENLADQLIEAFDNITAKSAKTRLDAYELLRKNLTQRCMVDFVFSRKITALEAINRCLKRSKGQDLGHAASLVSVLCSIIGPTPETDPIFSELTTHLLALLADQTIQPNVRSSCAQATAICTYILEVEGFLEQVMNRLFAVYGASCAKGDGTMPHPSEQLALLHSNCLQGWTLLLTAVYNNAPHVAIEIVEEYMDKITELLDSPHLDVKKSAGEALAVMCELIKLQNEDITSDDFTELCDKIRDLVTDSQKSRGKKDLRQQRSNFREILASIEEGEQPHIVIKFGGERLVLETWSRRRQYEAFCELFGAGFNHHLAENEVLRDVFNLGPVLIHMDLPRVKRSDNSYGIMIADKNRSKNMRKLRDKRIVLID